MQGALVDLLSDCLRWFGGIHGSGRGVPAVAYAGRAGISAQLFAVSFFSPLGASNRVFTAHLTRILLVFSAFSSRWESPFALPRDRVGVEAMADRGLLFEASVLARLDPQLIRGARVFDRKHTRELC